MLASVAAAPTSGCKLATAPSGMPGGGHTHWCNGNSFYDGFTTALPPNTSLAGGLAGLDSDMSSEDEDDGGPTYAAVTSRSYHPGGVNALFADGSVHSSRTRSTFRPGVPWARSAAARSSRPTLTDAPAHPSVVRREKAQV